MKTDPLDKYTHAFSFIQQDVQSCVFDFEKEKLRWWKSSLVGHGACRSRTGLSLSLDFRLLTRFASTVPDLVSDRHSFILYSVHRKTVGVIQEADNRDCLEAESRMSQQVRDGGREALCRCLIHMADTVSWTSPKRHTGIDKTSTAAEPS